MWGLHTSTLAPRLASSLRCSTGGDYTWELATTRIKGGAGWFISSRELLRTKELTGKWQGSRWHESAEPVGKGFQVSSKLTFPYHLWRGDSVTWTGGKYSARTRFGWRGILNAGRRQASTLSSCRHPRCRYSHRTVTEFRGVHNTVIDIIITIIGDGEVPLLPHLWKPASVSCTRGLGI